MSDKALGGLDIMVTFMIIFYVSYCYARYEKQFDDVELIMRGIVHASTLARKNFPDDPDQVHRLWRYLNLQHIIAYTGLTSAYNLDNFYEPLVQKYGLLGSGEDEVMERAHFETVDIDEQGLRAFGMYEGWSLDIIHSQSLACHLSAPLQAAMDAQIVSVKKLYAYSYQVLPYIYTHLVSISCTCYLCFNAFMQGLEFQPSSTYTFGAFLPAINVFMTTLCIFGLLEVGDTILDPFGNDPEDFAVLHIVEWTIVSSLEAITVPKRADVVKSKTAAGPSRGVNRYAFSSEREVRAAMFLTFLVARWKRRKQREKAEAAARRQAKRHTSTSTSGLATTSSSCDYARAPDHGANV